MQDKITVLLIDDESDGREVLRHLLTRHAEQVSIVGEANNADMACKLITQLKPDLVFLDIQMPKKTGFSMLQNLPSIAFEVIFVTSYEQYALTAIKFNALDYLLKPLDSKELKQAVEKAHRRILDKKNSEAQILSMLNSLNKQNLKKIAVHVKENVRLIDQNEIVYIEAQGSYCKIVLQNKEEFIICKILKDFEDYLGSNSSFIRISKSILINANFIITYGKGEPCVLMMKNEKTFEISRRKKQEVIDRVTAKINQ